MADDGVPAFGTRAVTQSAGAEFHKWDYVAPNLSSAVERAS